MRPIAVLGCGPSGLLAAHAATFTGRPIVIVSRAQKSRIGGAQYLHRAIPGLTDDKADAMLQYLVDGDPFTYQNKAYGREIIPPFVSFEHVRDGMVEPAWNLRDVYEQLWIKFKDSINDMEVTPKWIIDNAGKFELVINSVPRMAVCQERNSHHFHGQRIRIHNECILNAPSENTIWYDGTKDRSWYRASMIFGVGSTEWGMSQKLPYTELVEVNKPISTNCDCLWDQGNLVHVGRFGRWTKGVLTHHAFEDTFNHLGARDLINGRYLP